MDMDMRPEDVFFSRHSTQDGIDLIKEFEGLHLATYRCPSKILTIGYGHTRTVREAMRITKDEAENLLAEDVRLFERGVSRLVKVPLNDNQFSALVCFSFNVGLGNLDASTLLKLLNRGWYEQVPVQLMRWDHANGEVMGGLARRRAAEGRLWNKG
jgi:lysozyme